MIIAFSGTDGAGKSTQINLLATDLEAAGRPIKYVWARGGYTPLMLTAKNVALRSLGRRGGSEGFDQSKSDGYSKKRVSLMRRPLIVKVWLAMAIIDLALLYGIYVRYMSAKGYVVICDRYTQDTKIDFLRNFPGVFREHGVLWRLLEAFSPRPNMRILLTVPVVVSVERSLEKNEPFPDDVSTLEFRLAHYQAMQDSLGASDLALSGTDTIEAVASKIETGVRDAQARLLSA